MEYFPLISETYWLIDVANVSLGDKSVGAVKGVVDTGTSVIVGPKAYMDKLISALPDKPDCANLG